MVKLQIPNCKKERKVKKNFFKAYGRHLITATLHAALDAQELHATFDTSYVWILTELQ